MPSLPLPQGKPLDVPRTIQQALELHHQGRIAEAERLYAAVLAARPDHFDALQMLGVIKLSRGDAVTALRLVVGGDAAAAEVAAGAFEPRPRAQRHEPPRGGAGKLRRGAQAQGPVRRGAQQSRQRADRARTQRRGARQLQARHRHQARLCGSVLQPRQRASRRSTATPTRSRATTAPSRCGRTTPSRIATAARCSTSSAGRPTRSLCYDRALAIASRFRRGDAQPLRRAARAAAHRRNAARPGTAADRPPDLCRGALHARHADGGLQPHRRGAGELREGGGAQARLQQGALGRRARRRCRSSTPRRRRSPTQRADYERRLRALRAAYEAGHIPGDMSKGLGMAQPFFLAYQGHNDRDLQRLFGGLAARIMADRYGAAELAPPPAPGEPVRVGIVSGFFYQHSVWKIGVRGWISATRPQRASRCPATTPAPSRMPRPSSRGSTASASCRGRTRPRRWRQIILADRPHVLLYPGHRHEPGGVRTGGAPPCRRRNAATSAIRRPADSDHGLFPQRRIDRAARRPGALFGKAGEAAQHRLPLRAAGVRAGGGDARGTGAASGVDGLLVRAIAVQVSAAARRGVRPHRARSRRLPVRVHPPFRPAASPSCSSSGSIAPSPPPASRPRTIACSCTAWT